MLPDLETKCVPIQIDDICSVWDNCRFKKLFNHSSSTESPEFRIIMKRNVQLYNIYFERNTIRMFFMMRSIKRNNKMRKTEMKQQKHHRSDLPQKKSDLKVYMKKSFECGKPQRGVYIIWKRTK